MENISDEDVEQLEWLFQAQYVDGAWVKGAKDNELELTSGSHVNLGGTVIVYTGPDIRNG